MPNIPKGAKACYFVDMRAFYICLCLVGLFVSLPGSAQTDKEIYVLRIDGAIAPAYTDYLKSGINRAEAAQAEMVIIELNTPGGLLSSTRQMVSAIMTADIPVAVYVTPSGAHAASAGTFILMAAHIAAMDEGTNAGAATPVKMSVQLSQSEQETQPFSKEVLQEFMQGMQDPNEESLKKKSIEDTTAFMRAITEIRGRNAEWAQKAVIDAASITAQEALKLNVIDLVATSRDDLLTQMNGRTVTLKNGMERTVNTENVRVVEWFPDILTEFMALISDPNVAAVLMMIGIYGLILEFYAPGTMVSGTIGALCLLMAFYAFSILPVTGLGAMLIAAGLIFMFAEIFIPSFGVLGIAGMISLAIGFAIMFDGSELMGVALEWRVIIGILISTAIFMGIGFIVFVRSVITKELKSGPEAMIGQEATVLEWNGHEGAVSTSGERWNAVSPADEEPFKKGEKVLISAVDELKLKVRGI